MDKWNRFLAKNPWFSYMLLGITLASAWFYYFTSGHGLVFTIIFSLFAAFIYCLVPIGAANKLTIKAAKKLDDECDPYPLLLESEDQLSYVKNAGRRQLIVINHVTALTCIGKRREAYEELRSMNIDLVEGTTLETKATYYIDMSVLSIDAGKYEESVEYHTKASQIVGVIKNNKLKESFFSSLRSIAADQAIYRKDFDTALTLLGSIEDKTKRQSVGKAFSYGEIAIAKGDIVSAKNNLLYVINNGNKLYCVEEARKLLETL